MTDSQPPVSSRHLSLFPYEGGLGPDALSQVNRYRDEAALSRVWNRLESRRRRAPGPPMMFQLVAATALLAVGVFSGMVIEREREDSLAVEPVSSEIIVAQQAPTGTVSDGLVRRERPVTDKLDDQKLDKVRTRRSGRSPSRFGSPSPVKEGVLEGAPEVALVEVQEELLLPPPQPEWLILADRGEHAASFQKLDEAGGFDAVVANGSSEELMELADVARFVGRQGRAIQALRAVTERFEGDANAPLAAMILGNLLSRAGDVQGAAEAYALNRRLSPGGDFAEDALAREFDMALSNDDLLSVERLRAQYEMEFPKGRHLADMRTEEARLIEQRGALIKGVDEGPTEAPSPRAERARPEDDEASSDDDAMEVSSKP